MIFQRAYWSSIQEDFVWYSGIFCKIFQRAYWSSPANLNIFSEIPAKCNFIWFGDGRLQILFVNCPNLFIYEIVCRGNFLLQHNSVFFCRISYIRRISCINLFIYEIVCREISFFRITLFFFIHFLYIHTYVSLKII